MADVLALLRDYHVSGRTFVETDAEIIFGDFAWPKTTKTNFKVCSSGRDGAPKDYYTLESVVYLLRNIDLQHVQYVRQAANAKVPAVLLPDRKDLLAYLTGEANTAPSIDRAAPVDISLRRSVAKRQPSELLPHLRRDGNDLSGAEAFTHDSEAKRARLIAANDENVDNVTVQAASKSMQIDEDSIARKQRRLASNLDALLAGRGSSLMANDQAKSSSLTEAIPIDQIEALRAKYLATQQQRIKTDDIDRMLEASVPTSAPSVVPSNDSNASAVPGSVLLRGTRPGLHSSALSGEQQSIIRIDDTVSTQPYTDSSVPRAALVADEAAVRAIVTRERRWRTRVSVLQSQGKTFYENIVLGILRNVILKEDAGNTDPRVINKMGYVPGATMATAGGFPQPLAVGASYAKPALGSTNYTNTGSAMAISTGQHGMSVTNSTVPPHHPQMHYSRYDQERFASGREETAGFRIDTMATYHGKALASMVTGSANPSSVSDNTPVSQTPGRTGRGATGSETPLPYQEPPGPRDPRGFGSGVPMTPSATPDAYRGLRSTADARLAARNKARSSRIPIIIIPAAPTSLITMYNARDILQDLRYITSQEKQASGVRRENEILIHRQKPDGRSVPYRVVDQPHKLQPDEWNRVVAVFVQGQAWQFKGWPIGSDPAVIFSMIKGFHLKHTNKPLDVNVAKWNVRVINLDQRRHLDKANFQLIWDQLDKHIAKCKPFLRS